jgi:UDP-2,3-diacylglucosamine pyrophosphatase LpxH
MQAPLFEELYVISDLHIGGTKGSPIFNQSAELAALVQFLTQRTASGSIGLVIDGDFIDLLAEDLPGYVASPRDAENALQAILSHADFSQVWTTLKGFVRVAHHILVVVLGNHDLELMYPNVQEAIRQYLAEDDEAARGRIVFATSGAGYCCEVGKRDGRRASVLCVHGNEFDSWNAVSPEAMTRIVRAATLGKESQLLGEPPNPGAQMVKDVMNGIKRAWPFVDLLKPEMDGVFSILLALEPEQASALGRVLELLCKAATTGEVRVKRVLGGPSVVAPAGEQRGPDWKRGRKFEEFLGQSPTQSQLLADAWNQAAQEGISPAQLAGEEDQVLGAGRVVWNLLTYSVNRIKSGPDEALRAALADWGGGKETWDLKGACDVFDHLADIGPNASVVIAGHTHLRRQKRFSGGALYLNTGTWARLLRLDQGVLDSQTSFAPLYQAIRAGSMGAIDSLPSEVLLRQPTVAVVRLNGHAQVQAALCEFQEHEISLVANASWENVG